TAASAWTWLAPTPSCSSPRCCGACPTTPSSTTRCGATTASPTPTGSRACRSASRPARRQGRRTGRSPCSRRRVSCPSERRHHMAAVAHDWVAFYGERYPDRVALADGETGATTTWAELDDHVGRLATALVTEVGLRRG